MSLWTTSLLPEDKFSQHSILRTLRVDSSVSASHLDAKMHQELYAKISKYCNTERKTKAI